MIIQCESCSRKFIVKDKIFLKKEEQFSVDIVQLPGTKCLFQYQLKLLKNKNDKQTVVKKLMKVLSVDSNKSI